MSLLFFVAFFSIVFFIDSALPAALLDFHFSIPKSTNSACCNRAAPSLKAGLCLPFRLAFVRRSFPQPFIANNMPLFIYGPLVIGLWIAWKTWNCREFPKSLRLFFCVFWTAASLSFALQSHLFGSLAGPDVDSHLLLILDWGLATLLLTFAGVAAWELASLIVKAVRRLFGRKAAVSGQEQGTRPCRDRRKDQDKDQPESPSRRRFLAMTAASGMGLIVPAAAVTSGIGVHEAVSSPAVRSWEVYIPDLPGSLHDLRIVQLSDLHIGPLWTQAQASSIADKVSAMKPDLVCITGDLADGSPSGAQLTARPDCTWHGSLPV